MNSSVQQYHYDEFPEPVGLEPDAKPDFDEFLAYLKSYEAEFERYGCMVELRWNLGLDVMHAEFPRPQEAEKFEKALKNILEGAKE